MQKKLRLPSTYVEVKENEMEYLDGTFLWRTLIGVGMKVVGWGCTATSAIVTAAGGDEKVAAGLAIGGIVLKTAGGYVSGIVFPSEWVI